jgi:predicted GNAT superfamily acetyltransferase
METRAMKQKHHQQNQPEITIRRPHSPQEYKALQEAQQKAWGITQDGYVVPVATMVGAQFHGGLVLGAFLPDGEAVGLSFSFMGRIHGELCLYSQLTGVVPGYQGHGIGSKMKWAQWEYAHSHQIPVVAWAYDPFQAGNAHFNLNMLRGKARRFIDDMYGPRTDQLNAGVPTDRLIVEWPTSRDPRSILLEPIVFEEITQIIKTRLAEKRYFVVEHVNENFNNDIVLIEIPKKLADVQQNDAGEAARWRTALRESFHRAFHKGYVVTDFLRTPGDPDRCYYRLERNVWVS